MASTSTPRHSAVSDVLALLARLVLGTVLIAHGWQKLTEWTIAGTTASFGEMGVPLPEIAAPLATVVELGGGIAIVLGLFTRVVGVLVAIQMAIAAAIVHLPAGIFIENGGWELVGVIGAASLLLAAFGPGRISLDHPLFGRRARSRAGSPAGSRARATVG